MSDYIIIAYFFNPTFKYIFSYFIKVKSNFNRGICCYEIVKFICNSFNGLVVNEIFRLNIFINLTIII